MTEPLWTFNFQLPSGLGLKLTRYGPVFARRWCQIFATTRRPVACLCAVFQDFASTHDDIRKMKAGSFIASLATQKLLDELKSADRGLWVMFTEDGGSFCPGAEDFSRV